MKNNHRDTEDTEKRRVEKGRGTYLWEFALEAIHQIRIGESGKGDFLLRFRVANSSDGENAYNSVFDRHLRKNMLINMTTVQQGAHLELAFSITFKEPKQQQQFLRELNALPEVDQAMLIAVDKGEEC